jgi:putative SOS response-associated peptidase YedK
VKKRVDAIGLHDRLESGVMCGRYRLSRRKEVLAEHFGADFADMDWEPRWNVAPTQPVPVIRRDSKGPTLRASLMRWGLIPSWSSDPSIGARTINARSETARYSSSLRFSPNLRVAMGA